MSGVETALIVAATTAASAALEGYGQYQQGKAEARANNQNADILRKNAAKKRLENAINEDIARSEARRDMSRKRVNLSASGTLDSSSATSYLGQLSADYEQNAQNMRYSGMSEAANYTQQANLQQYYGRTARQNGRNAFYMGLIGGGVQGVSTYGRMGGFNKKDSQS